jgi:hypothetical protein
VNSGGYAAQDIYNEDETGQFWRQVPQRSLATGKRAGRNKDKQRITVSLCCNATGTDKRELSVIASPNAHALLPEPSSQNATGVSDTRAEARRG